MNFSDYQDLSKRTMPEVNTYKDLQDTASNFALGFVCEAAEAGDHIKKFAHHGHELDQAKVKEEIGDALFYAAGLASLFNFDLGSIAADNVEKLRKRYEKGFSKEASIKRVDVK